MDWDLRYVTSHSLIVIKNYTKPENLTDFSYLAKFGFVRRENNNKSGQNRG